MESNLFILAIGFLAQVFFAARGLVQWILSERARKVLSPSIFWILSLAGAYLLCIYGWLRNDFAIVFGQFVSYYVYLWNLNAKGVWQRLPWIVRLVLFATPLVAICLVIGNAGTFFEQFLNNADVPMWLVVFGSAGQILFTLRFIYQWLYCRRDGQSQLPAGFWRISLAGALIILSYGILRLDPVLMVGHGFGLITYIRNLMLAHNSNR